MGPLGAADLESGSFLRNQVMGDLEDGPLVPNPEPQGPRALGGMGANFPRKPGQGPWGPGCEERIRHARGCGWDPNLLPAPGLVCGGQSFQTDPRRGADATTFLQRAGRGSTRAARRWPFKSPPPSPSPRPAARGGGAGEPRRGLAQRAPPPRPPRGGNRQPRLVLTSDRLSASDRGLGAKPDLLGLE